jgi:hypothetical protein
MRHLAIAICFLLIVSATPAGSAGLKTGSAAHRLLVQAWSLQRQAGIEYQRGQDRSARRLYRRGLNYLYRARSASGAVRRRFAGMRRRYVFDVVILAQTIFTRGLKLYDAGLKPAGCRLMDRSMRLARIARGLAGGGFGRMFRRFYFSAAMDLNSVVEPARLPVVLKKCAATGRSLIAAYSRVIRNGRAKHLKRSLGVASDPTGYPVQGKVRWLTTRKRAFVRASLSRAKRHLPLIKRVFKAHGIPPGLAYMAIIESGFHTDPVSRAGAVGLWQFMPQTARDYGLKVGGGVDERLDPVKSTYAAARHLRHLFRRFRDWPLAVAAYNCGQGCVESAMRRTGRRTYWQLAGSLPPETREFVAAVMAAGVVSLNRKYHGL